MRKSVAAKRAAAGSGMVGAAAVANVRAELAGKVVSVAVDGPLPPVEQIVEAAVRVSATAQVTVDLTDAWLEQCTCEWMLALVDFGRRTPLVAFIVPADRLQVASAYSRCAAHDGLLRRFFSCSGPARDWLAWMRCRDVVLRAPAAGLPKGPSRRRAASSR